MTDSLNLGYKITMSKNANINHEFKGQGHTEVKYCMTTYFIGKKSVAQTLNHVKNPIHLTLRSKVKVILES